MKLNQLPNIITVIRFLLVPPVVLYLLNERYGAALVVFAAAGFSDALDGYLAKRYHWSSRLGAMMDPLADKLLLVSSFVSLGWLNQIPPWLVAVVILRDLVIVTGAIVYNLRIEHLEAAPSIISKLNTLAQIALVMAVMFTQAVAAVPEPWLEVLIYGVLATTLCSGVDYVWTWGRRAWLRRGS